MLRLAYSPKQAGYLLGLGHAKIYELIGAHKLDARKADKRTLILTYSLLQYLAELEPVSEAAPTARTCARCGEFIMANIKLRLACSPKEAWYLLSLGHTKFYELISAHKLDARKAGNRTLILTYSILRYLSDLEPVSGAAPTARLSRCERCGELIITKLSVATD